VAATVGRPPSPFASLPNSVTQIEPSRSLRSAYLEWVEEQVEAFKESIPRADLLRLAEQAIDELRLGGDGQYQLTELLLCTAVDRKIVKLLKLPSYRSWCADRAVLASIRVAMTEAGEAGDGNPDAEPTAGWTEAPALTLVKRDVA
jgi:hypothetical protein